MKHTRAVCENYQFCEFSMGMKQFSIKSHYTDAIGWQSVGLVQRAIARQLQVSARSDTQLGNVKDVHKKAVVQKVQLFDNSL